MIIECFVFLRLINKTTIFILGQNLLELIRRVEVSSCLFIMFAFLCHIVRSQALAVIMPITSSAISTF